MSFFPIFPKLWRMETPSMRNWICIFSCDTIAAAPLCTCVHSTYRRLLCRGAPPFQREPSITSRYGFTWERQHLEIPIHACTPLPRLEGTKEHIRFVHFLLINGPIQTQCLQTAFPLYPFGCNFNLKALLLKRCTFVHMALCWSAEWLTDASVQIQWCSEVAFENLLWEGGKKMNTIEKCI